MNNINDFIIRDMSKETQTETTFLKGIDAILEYIRQTVKIEKNVLWWDYQFGLDVTMMSEDSIIFWLRKCLSVIPFVEELLSVKTEVRERVLYIEYSIKFSNEEVGVGSIVI